ncbi:PilZ domain-containing protein [Planctomycetota bacterium]
MLNSVAKNLLPFVRKNSSRTGGDKNIEKRKEQRLSCDEKMQFSNAITPTSSKGRLIDVSSGGAAFTTELETQLPRIGDSILVRIKLPLPGRDADDFVRRGYVRQVGNTDDSLHRVAVEFAKPLPYKPVEKCRNQDVELDEVIKIG